jgi:hypothetical protein
MSYRLDKMLGKLREDAPVLPSHIKENVMAAIRADAFSVQRGFAWRYAVGFGAFLILGTGGTVFAAQQVNPGNILYPIKRASETAYVGIQTNPQAKADAQQVLIDRRFDEADKVADSDDNTNNDNNDLIENQLAADATAASDAWVTAQEQAYSNDIQYAASR